MIRFLETEGVSDSIFRLIKRAKKEIIIASPFLKIRPKLKNYFDDAIDREVNIIFVHGRGKLGIEDIHWFDKIGDKVKHFTNFYSHAKCYLNEQEAIVTSLNLYQYSQDNNYEMGVNISKEESMYMEVYDSVKTIIKHSNDWKYHNIIKNREGYCIRCKTGIPLDFYKPYCDSCFLEWETSSNYRHVDKYCHSCGKNETASMSRPLCWDCYKN